MMAALSNTQLQGELIYQHPLAGYTTWRVGGPAEQFYRPADLADLSVYLQQLPSDTDLLWLGLGSNLLIRDAGFKGAVIYLQGRLNEKVVSDDSYLLVGAGATCASVARFAAREGYAGAAFLAGIPGTMGGALAMNAGAFGGETWSIIDSVTSIDRQGTVRQRTPEDYQVAYRHVAGPDGEWFVGARLKLTQGGVEQEQQNIRELLEQRNQSQPIGKASAGSTFKNPPGDYAARLIESCGLKGFHIGDAWVSEKHANFILNMGKATAADIETVMDQVQKTVFEQQGVELVREVRVVGESL